MQMKYIQGMTHVSITQTILNRSGSKYKHRYGRLVDLDNGMPYNIHYAYRYCHFHNNPMYSVESWERILCT